MILFALLYGCSSSDKNTNSTNSPENQYVPPYGAPKVPTQLITLSESNLYNALVTVLYGENYVGETSPTSVAILANKNSVTSTSAYSNQINRASSAIGGLVNPISSTKVSDCWVSGIESTMSTYSYSGNRTTGDWFSQRIVSEDCERSMGVYIQGELFGITTVGDFSTACNCYQTSGEIEQDERAYDHEGQLIRMVYGSSTSSGFSNAEITSDDNRTDGLYVYQNGVAVYWISNTSSYEVDYTANETTRTESSKVATTKLNGSINVETIEPIVSAWIDNTYSGSLEITGANNSALTIRYNMDGSYTIWLSSDTEKGINEGYPQIITRDDINARLSDDYANNISEAQPIDIGGDINGVINYGDDQDYFKIDLPNSGTLSFNTISEGFIKLYLLDVSGEIIVENLNGGDDHFHLWQYLSSGTYYLHVQQAHINTGSVLYTLRTQFVEGPTPVEDHGNNIDTASAIELNSHTPGFIDYPGDEDYFTFSVPSDGFFTIYNNGFRTASISILDINGAVFAEDSDSGHQSYKAEGNARISLPLSMGTYYIRVLDTATLANKYYGLHTVFVDSAMITDDHGNDTISATVLALDSTVSGRLDYAGDKDYFAIIVLKDVNIDIQTSGTTDTYGHLYDATGQELFASDDNFPTLNFNIKTSLTAGTYYILVEHFRLGEGDYDLSATLY